MTEDESKRTHALPEHNGYLIPAPLLHRLLLLVATAIISIGGYMAVWGMADAAFKSQVLTELGWMKGRVVELGDDMDEHDSRHDAND